MRDEATFLQDMLDAALRVQRHIAGKTYEELLKDEILQDAVVHRLAVIGEAAKQISAQTRQSLAPLPFDDMAKMRNILAHAYWSVDYKIIWDTAVNDLPDLVKHLTQRLRPGPSGGAPP